jgi:glycosyltransferase involved in cell wall biosynthesis
MTYTPGAKIPRFSVVMPVYNKGPHIARAIQSVLDQSCDAFELLLINDASTDNSMEVVSRFEDPRIRVLQRNESGPGGYAARNLGIEEARSEWVAFLDADDEWYPDHLQKFIELSRRFPEAGVLASGREIVQRNGAMLTGDYYRMHNTRGSHFMDLETYLEVYVKGLRPIWTSVACIRKDVLQRAGGFPAGISKRGGDIDTWLRCIEQAGGMAWSAHIGARYYKDSVNMVTRTSLNTAVAELATVRRLLNKYTGRTARLLKMFANNRNMKAFKEHSKVTGKKKYSYLTRLYLSVIPIRKIPRYFTGSATKKRSSVQND